MSESTKPSDPDNLISTKEDEQYYSEDFDIEQIFKDLRLSNKCIEDFIENVDLSSLDEDYDVVWSIDYNTMIYFIQFKYNSNREDFMDKFIEICPLNDFDTDEVQEDYQFVLSLYPMDEFFNED